MRSLIFLFSILCMMSCGTESAQQITDKVSTTPKQSVETPKVNVAPKEKSQEDRINQSPIKVMVNPNDVIGTYVGMFEAEEYDDSKKPTWANKINITISEVEGESVKGHSVVAGNHRPFSGKLEVNEKHSIKIVAAEPGDDRYDGVFTFIVDPSLRSFKGTWEANDKRQAVTKRKYDLEKTTFKYDPELQPTWELDEMYDTWDEERGESEMLSGDFLKINASLKELKKEDVENLYMADLEVIRNAIYARHGYSFKNRRMRYVFNHVDWYIPYSTDIRDQLTDLEKKNIELLKRYEEHAEKYYDYFGR